VRRAALPILMLAACGPRMEFTPHSAMQAQSARVCQLAVEVFEGDLGTLQEAGAEQLGKLDVSGSDFDPEDVAERAAEHGATHMIRIARQRQLVSSGGMIIGTGGPGFSTGMYVPSTQEQTYSTYALYRAAPDRMPEQLRCAPPH
jgi:hypothetical protein